MSKTEIINSFNSKLKGREFTIDNIVVELSIEYLLDLGYKNPEKIIEYIVHEHPELMITLYNRFIKHFCVKYNILTLSKNNQILMYYVSN